MNTEQLVTTTENELRILSSALTDPHDGECLLCYVYRMLEHGCTGLRWALHYRDLRAPRATALEARLGQKGGYCDCEIFMNAYEPAPGALVSRPGVRRGRHDLLGRSGAAPAAAAVPWGARRVDEGLHAVGQAMARRVVRRGLQGRSQPRRAVRRPRLETGAGRPRSGRVFFCPQAVDRS